MWNSGAELGSVARQVSWHIAPCYTATAFGKCRNPITVLYLHLYISLSLSLLSTPRFYLPADRRGLFSVLGDSRETHGSASPLPRGTHGATRNYRRNFPIGERARFHSRVQRPRVTCAFEAPIGERARRNVDVLSVRGRRDGQRNDAIYVQVRIQGWKPWSPSSCVRPSVLFACACGVWPSLSFFLAPPLPTLPPPPVLFLYHSFLLSLFFTTAALRYDSNLRILDVINACLFFIKRASLEKE